MGDWLNWVKRLPLDKYGRIAPRPKQKGESKKEQG